MNDIIDFIMRGNTEMCPEVLISIMVFVLILDAISNLVNAISRGVKR